MDAYIGIATKFKGSRFHFSLVFARNELCLAKTFFSLKRSIQSSFLVQTRSIFRNIRFHRKQNAFNLYNVFSINEQCRKLISSRLFFIVKAVLQYGSLTTPWQFFWLYLLQNEITTKPMREMEIYWLLFWRFLVFTTLSKKVLFLDRWLALSPKTHFLFSYLWVWWIIQLHQ